MDFKMCVVVREDVPMTPGKMAVQVAHAAVGCVLSGVVPTDTVMNWFNEGQKKVVLRTPDLEHLLKIEQKADELSVINYVVSDFGLTELMPNTVTCIGLGPDTNEALKPITGRLKLW
jgi:peptidyl-tRNA hydrolase, PTH2 family